MYAERFLQRNCCNYTCMMYNCMTSLKIVKFHLKLDDEKKKNYGHSYWLYRKHQYLPLCQLNKVINLLMMHAYLLDILYILSSVPTKTLVMNAWNKDLIWTLYVVNFTRYAKKETQNLKSEIFKVCLFAYL